jgi:hypothetical protein
MSQVAISDQPSANLNLIDLQPLQITELSTLDLGSALINTKFKEVSH